MFRKSAALALLALLTGAAAPVAKAPAAKAPVAKAAPPAKAPAPKAAHGPAAAPFDPRDPASLVAVLNAAGAKAQLGTRTQDTVAVAVTSTAANFSALFVGCSPQGRACQALVLDSGPEAGSPSLQQINGFNQSSAMCRAFQDKAGKPHVVYSTLMLPGQTREHLVTELAAWQGCIADFRAFAKDPVTYLAEAP